MAWPLNAQAPKANAPLQWQLLHAKATEAYQAGDYTKSTAFAEAALKMARRIFGNRDQRTLINL